MKHLRSVYLPASPLPPPLFESQVATMRITEKFPHCSSSSMPTCPWKLPGPSPCSWDKRVTLPWPTRSPSGSSLPTPQPAIEVPAPTTLTFDQFLSQSSSVCNALLSLFTLPFRPHTQSWHHFVRKSLPELQCSFFSHTSQKMSQSSRAHTCL